MRFIFLLVHLAIGQTQLTSIVPCECPKLACPPCQHLDDRLQEFYTEKCGEDRLKMRSCAKPKCVSDSDKCDAAASSAGAVSGTNSMASTISAKKDEDHNVGSVKVIKGSVTIIGSDGNVREIGDDDPVYEHDSVITEAKSGVVVDLKGGNRLHILERSRVQIQEHHSSDEQKRTVLSLIRGKIRNQVKEKYDGKTSVYQVITPGLTADVHGTDFVVSDEVSTVDSVRVETFEGVVQLSERLGKAEVSVHPGEAVSYDLEGLPKASDWSNPAEQGSFRKLEKLSGPELAALDKATLLIGEPVYGKPVKRPERQICQTPPAKMNQCSWKCVGNPGRAKICRTDLSGVSCVRQRCNANGEWSEETRLPASASEICSAGGTKVQDCDY